MQYTTLGRTGLKVGVAGLGCGGSSRLGQAKGETTAYSVDLVRQALDLGINLLDTAKSYGTEHIVGRAIEDLPRDSVVISTKHTTSSGAQEVITGLDQSLKALRTDYIDIFQLHGVSPSQYDQAIDEIVPALLGEVERGKVRFLGITESGREDHRHVALRRALDDDQFDVMMLAFNMMHQNARSLLFPKTQKQNVGTLLMFTVRSLFSVSGRLQREMKQLAADGKIPRWLAESDEPLEFLIHEGGAESVIDAAYRFARHEPGTDVVLFGTGDMDHLKTNLGSILKPPLPIDDVQRLYKLFGHLEGVGLDSPGQR